MSPLEWLNAIIVVLGIPFIAKVLVEIGVKLKTLDSLKSEVNKNIKPDLKDVRERFANLEGKMQGFTANSSPISLTSKGDEILKISGLKKYINENKELLKNASRKVSPMSTAYDVQSAVFTLFEDYVFPPDVEIRLKETAFAAGIDIALLRRLGGIYFRDICIADLQLDGQGLTDDNIPTLFTEQRPVADI